MSDGFAGAWTGVWGGEWVDAGEDQRVIAIPRRSSSVGSSGGIAGGGGGPGMSHGELMRQFLEERVPGYRRAARTSHRRSRPPLPRLRELRDVDDIPEADYTDDELLEMFPAPAQREMAVQPTVPLASAEPPSLVTEALVAAGSFGVTSLGAALLGEYADVGAMPAAVGAAGVVALAGVVSKWHPVAIGVGALASALFMATRDD